MHMKNSQRMPHSSDIDDNRKQSINHNYDSPHSGSGKIISNNL